jgi:hypothetical protein
MEPNIGFVRRRNKHGIHDFPDFLVFWSKFAPGGAWQATDHQLTAALRRLGNVFYIPMRFAERWQSGRMHRTRNAAYPRGYPGFESLPLRQALVLQS